MNVIIAAIDFSDITPRVIDLASSLAKESNASIHLLHATAPDPDFVSLEAGPPCERDLRAKELKYEHEKLNEMTDQLRSQGIETKAFLTQGPTVDVILKHIRSYDTRLIVVGSHGHGALYHLVAGSVTTELLKQSPVPVLVQPCRKAD